MSPISATRCSCAGCSTGCSSAASRWSRPPTSTPTQLYEHGLQRAQFEPAIELLKQHTEVIELAGEQDYRLRTLEHAGVYHCPLDAEAHRHLLAGFRRRGRRAGRGRCGARDRGAHYPSAAARARDGLVRVRGAVRGTARHGRLHRACSALPYGLALGCAAISPRAWRRACDALPGWSTSSTTATSSSS